MLSQIQEYQNDYDFSHLLFYGDYACANFLTLYASKCKPMANKDYPAELKEEFGISDAHLFHCKMIADGYLESTIVEERLAGCSLEELQELMEKLDLPASGTKEEILTRLALNATLEQINKYKPQEESYSLSKMGKEYLNANKDLVDLYHRKDKYHITYNEYAAVKSTHPDASYEDLLWMVLEARFQKDVADADYVSVQKEYWNMFTLLLDQQKPVDALNALLNCFFMDLNAFTETYACIEDFKKSEETVPAYLSHVQLPSVTLHPEIIEKIASLKEAYNPKSAENISRNNVSYYVNTEQFLTILSRIYDGTFSLEDTEKELNGRVSTVLDHVLRADNL